MTFKTRNWKIILLQLTYWCKNGTTQYEHYKIHDWVWKKRRKKTPIKTICRTDKKKNKKKDMGFELEK